MNLNSEGIEAKELNEKHFLRKCLKLSKTLSTITNPTSI
ncbi:hypothetical protein LEP1GSC084_3808 [Leptospira interrogans serovar Medanensis str. L0448]|nr:hypothetical protein LEP1GSC080_4759 [Leptospira interrogans str. FPW2026]EKO71618.1 hypothetical protein LEP1GSC069_3214 [Leptospira interrogans serovar Canicola str. Fiocruz LV133]EKR81534.1 hypothetical protein LEP1GSC099_2774 [Leptospira interrogans str. UI 08452]EMN35120.1 hypothetical protein LEP1GSC084_3808 [Leptospira interrogans serovar Medanensis str. L0448]EMN39875.1 hypothetical protein LEP1GSC085_4657 [Leptospira interrogans str. L0996]EMN96011.1 hypothetical protein LEP1GSC110